MTAPARVTVTKVGMYVIVRRFWPDREDAYRMSPFGAVEHSPDHKNVWLGCVTVPTEVLDHFEWFEKTQGRTRKKHPADSDPGNPETW